MKTEEQRDFYKNCPVHCVKAKRGSLILWDSRTVHQGIESKKGRRKMNIREVIYVCYTPRSRANEKILKKKRKAFEDKRMTTHWPCKVTLFPKNPRTYGKSIPEIVQIPPPNLTNIGKKLAGF